MSSRSDGSTSVTKTRGFPKQCHCGRRVRKFTSSIADNPGRPFFKCESVKKDHIFKWVEEAVCEEVEDIIKRGKEQNFGFGTMKAEIDELKRQVERQKKTVQNLRRWTRMVEGMGVLSICACVTAITVAWL